MKLFFSLMCMTTAFTLLSSCANLRNVDNEYKNSDIAENTSNPIPNTGPGRVRADTAVAKIISPIR